MEELMRNSIIRCRGIGLGNGFASPLGGGTQIEPIGSDFESTVGEQSIGYPLKACSNIHQTG